jgi:hypothetical protein
LNVLNIQFDYLSGITWFDSANNYLLQYEAEYNTGSGTEARWLITMNSAYSYYAYDLFGQWYFFGEGSIIGYAPGDLSDGNVQLFDCNVTPTPTPTPLPLFNEYVTSQMRSILAGKDSKSRYFDGVQANGLYGLDLFLDFYQNNVNSGNYTDSEATKNFVRNPNCWAYDIDLTCFSPWNMHPTIRLPSPPYGPNTLIGSSNHMHGTLISPRHVIFCTHARYYPPNGSEMRFITKDNVVVTRTLVNTIEVPPGGGLPPDYTVGLLDSDVPNTITFAKVLPDNWKNRIDPKNKLLIIHANQDKSIFLSSFGYNGWGPNGISVNEQELQNFERLGQSVRLLDSGTPWFLVIDNNPIFIGQPSYSFFILINQLKSAVNQTMLDLGGGYQLTDINLDRFKYLSIPTPTPTPTPPPTPPIVHHLGKLNGTTWYNLGENFFTGSVINCIAFDRLGNLYAAGSFVTYEGNAINIAKWDGISWSSLGNLFDFPVFANAAPIYSICIDSIGNVYVGGYFNISLSGSASCIFKWDGISWSHVGTGISGSFGGMGIRCMNIDNQGNLYVGGNFTIAVGGIVTRGIAKWDGVSWSNVGDGLPTSSDRIDSIAVDSENNIYVGGTFSTIGGISVNKIAKWNGTSWSGLGSGLNISCSAICIDENDNVYVGGGFTIAGGISANKIAKWDGTSWSALGDGFNSNVFTLAAYNNDIYAAGLFTASGSLNARIAKWNGTSWSSLLSTSNYNFDDSIIMHLRTLKFDALGNLHCGY